MATFDGDTLIITLDAVVDGVLDVDVGEDLYTQWKTWVKQGNLKYPAAFRTTGGDELTSIINAGSYFFLRNDFGWRIKPFENDSTYFLVGNLAAQVTTLPVFKATTGAFTAAILGLQPVTQGVTPAMGDQLAFTSFQNAVCIDSVNGHLGTGAIGSNEIGTRKAPAKLPSDALIIAAREGLTTFNIANDLIVSEAVDFSAGYTWHGDRPELTLNFLSAPNVLNSAVTNLTLSGELDGVNTLRNASIGTVTNVSGFVEKCAFFGDVTLNGGLSVFESYSQKEGEGFVIFNTGNHVFQTSDWVRSMGITNMTGGVHTIHMRGGQLHLDNLCTGGVIYLRGTYSKAPDDQSNGTILIDQTDTAKAIEEIHGQMARSVFIDTEQVTNGNGFQQTPFNNWTDGVDYAEANGLSTLVVKSDAVVDRQLKNFTIIGIGVPVIDLNGHIMDKTILERCQITGTYTGEIQANECAVVNLGNMAGVFLTCSMAGVMTVASGANLLISRVAPAVAAQPWTLSMNSGAASICAIHNSSGGVIITNMDHVGDILHFNGSQGEIVFGASNTLGNAVCTGDVFVDEALNGGTVIDRTRVTSQLVYRDVPVA